MTSIPVRKGYKLDFVTESSILGSQASCTYVAVVGMRAECDDVQWLLSTQQRR